MVDSVRYKALVISNKPVTYNKPDDFEIHFAASFREAIPMLGIIEPHIVVAYYNGTITDMSASEFSKRKKNGHYGTRMVEVPVLQVSRKKESTCFPGEGPVEPYENTDDFKLTEGIYGFMREVIKKSKATDEDKRSAA